MNNFESLLYQVDQFVRKYYKNQIIKGFFLFAIVFLSTFLLVSGLEYIGQFNSFIRGFLFFSFLFINGYIFIKYIVIPLLQLFSFGKRINRFQAAKIIGDFFPSIDDKLLNTLQLEQESKENLTNYEFVQASIQQNSARLNKFTFTSAIDYSTNKKFLAYFLPILVVVIFTSILFPNIFNMGTKRVMNFNQVFEIAPDYSFQLLNEHLLVEEGKSLTIDVKIIPQPGKAVPNRIFLITNDGEFLMNNVSKNRASYTLANISREEKFYFKTATANSSSYKIQVAKRSSIGDFSVKMEYPSYIERKNEEVANPGDLLVPEGTILTWNGTVKNSKSLEILMQDSAVFQDAASGFRWQHKSTSSYPLTFILENKKLGKKDSTKLNINVIKDQYPKIIIQKQEDSIHHQRIYFSGEGSDDYGITQLIFTYEIQRKSGEVIRKDTPVPGISGSVSPFSMTFDIRNVPLELEDELSFYFTIYDNDGINGSKSTRSQNYYYSSPSLKELQEKRAEDKNKAQEDLKNLIKESKEFNEQLNLLKKEIFNSKTTNFQQQKQIENLRKQHDALQEKIEKTKEELSSSFEEKEKLTEAEEKLLEKQKQLEEMLDQLMDEELAKLLEELEKMLQENENKDLLEKLEDTELSAEEMEKQLDRTMEMLKRMDVEERVEDLQKNLENLAQEQMDLKEQLENNEISKEEALERQEELNQDFKDLKEDLEEMLEKNEGLNRPFSFDDLNDLMDSIEEEQQSASENLEKNNQSGATENQQNASDKMEEAASQLQAQMSDSQQEQNEEDMASLRALLDNLIKLSFDQEENMLAFDQTNIHDPYFVQLGKDQRNVMDNFKPVKDSLETLSQRIPEIASFIHQEVKEIDKQFKYIPSHIGEREKRQLLIKQQYTMMHLNNLALFLNESLEQLQQQMQNQGEGSGEGSCDTPGGGGQGQGSEKKGGKGSDGLDGMKEMIKKQLEKMQKGNSPGGNIPGEQLGGVLPIQSKEAAKMAAEQSAMQKKIQELRDKLNQEGKGEGNQLNDLLKELEKQQEDLINKNWDRRLIDRQQEILTRLLESEKALQERGWDEERESNSGKDEDYGNQIEFLEYKKQKERQIELLRTLDPAFSRYYKEKANAYFLEIN